ncbi:MAG: hypothetical protein GXP29_10610 [Planctomycetes bacterium]|nr:hypothetical protein [Planctomycetota bacterium]
MKIRLLQLAALMCFAPTVSAVPFELMTGVDADRWPGPSRVVSPTPGGGNSQDGMFFDDDRLAGVGPTGPSITFQGFGIPLLDPNEFGALSFIFKRASVPLGFGQLPFMGIDFLGGPLFDLDGDANDASRSLIPVDGQSAVVMPGTRSTIGLSFDTSGGTVSLLSLDATSTSEGSPGVSWKAANSVNILAGTEPDGTQTGPINPATDTRSGTLSVFVNTNGVLANVWRVSDLGYEFWQDTLLENSSTAGELGTFQYLGSLSGWYVRRDPVTGSFPALTGAGLGQTPWPAIGTNGLGETFITANGLAGGFATIGSGSAQDDFEAPNNGGFVPTDFGVYFDTVVIPNINPFSAGFVYLESLGFGINNSGDPVFLDSIGYDVVLVAQQAPTTDLRDYAGLQQCNTGPGPTPVPTECEAFDFDNDSDIDIDDFDAFGELLTGPDA